MDRQPTFQDIAASHHGDPIPSLMAEDSMNTTGVRVTQCLEILEVIRRHPGQTRGELAFIMAEDDAGDEEVLYLRIARRVSDLKKAGLVYEHGTRYCLRRHRTMTIISAMPVSEKVDND